MGVLHELLLFVALRRRVNDELSLASHFFFFFNLSQKRLFKLSTTSLQPLGNHSRGFCLALCSWHIMKTILRCGGKYWAITDVTATCSSEPWLQHCLVHEYFMVWCYFEWLGQVKGAEGVISNSAGGCVAALFPRSAHSVTPRSILTPPGSTWGQLKLRQDALTSHGGHPLQTLVYRFYTRCPAWKAPASILSDLIW